MFFPDFKWFLTRWWLFVWTSNADNLQTNLFLAKQSWTHLADPHWELYIVAGVHNLIEAHWLAWQLATEEVPGSNPSKGENLLISE